MAEQDWRAKTTLLRSRLAKFNPNHDELGRFSSGPGGGGGAPSTMSTKEWQTAQDEQRGGEGYTAETLLYDKGRLEAGTRVKMPDGTPATVRGQQGRVRSGALADGDDGRTFVLYNHLDIKVTSRPRRFGADKPRSMSDLHLQVSDAIQRDEKRSKSRWHGDKAARIARNVSIRTGVEVTAEQVQRVAQDLGMTRKQRRAAYRQEQKRRSADRKTWLKKFNPYHDDIGRFTEAGGNSTGAPGGYPGGRPVKGGKPSARKDKKGGGEPGSSKGNPIKTSDVNEALKLLSEGKHVELETVEQVSTMVNQLNKIVQDAVKKGKDAPSYDLCRVSVANTNIFCAEHKDIPRLKMPQLKGDPVKGSKAAGMKRNKDGEVDVAQQFIDHMKEKGAKVTRETVKANTLRASQSQLVGRKVAGMVTAAQAGKFDLEAGTIYVSKDGYIIDGHHRWAATIALDAGSGRLGDRTINVVRIDKPILEVLKDANEFTRGVGMKPNVGKSTRPL